MRFCRLFHSRTQTGDFKSSRLWQFFLFAPFWVGSKQWAIKLHIFRCALTLCKTVIRPQSVLMAPVPVLAAPHNPSPHRSLSEMCVLGILQITSPRLPRRRKLWCDKIITTQRWAVAVMLKHCSAEPVVSLLQSLLTGLCLWRWVKSL